MVDKYFHKSDNYAAFDKIGTPLFSFYNFSKCWNIKNYITVFGTNFWFGTNFILSRTMCLLTEVQDLNQVRPRAARFVDEWDKLDLRIIGKVIGEWRKRL